MGKASKATSKESANKKRNSKLVSWREKLEKYDINNICLQYIPNIMIMAELSTDFCSAIDIFHHGAQACSTNLISLNWGNFIEYLKKPASPARLSTSGLKDDYVSTYKAATEEARKYLLSETFIGDHIPSELCAKLIKLEIIKIIMTYSVSHRQKKSSLDSAKMKGKKGGKTPKETPRESICGEKEQLYVVIVGCYDPHVVEELFKCGVKLSAILEIAYSFTVFQGMECRESITRSRASSDTISEFLDLKVDPGIMLYMNSGNRSLSEYSIYSSVMFDDPSESASSSFDVDPKRRILCHFWMEVYKHIEGEHLAGFLLNTVHLRISPIYAVAPIKDTLDYDLQAAELFAHVYKEIMKIPDAKRQHANYLQHMKIYNIDFPPEKISIDSFTTYKKVVNSVPPECVTIDLLLHGVVEEVCTRLPNTVKSSSDRLCRESVSSKMAEPQSNTELRKSLTSQTRSSMNASCHSTTNTQPRGSKTVSRVSLTRESQSKSKEKFNKKQILLKRLANYLTHYRRSYGPFIRTGFLHHEDCLNDPRVKIKLSQKSFMIHESSLLELETLCFPRLPRDIYKIYSKGLLRCPLAQLWKRYENLNTAQICLKDNLMKDLSTRLELPIDEVTTAMNLIFFKSLICRGGSTRIENKFSAPTCDSIFCSKWKITESQVTDIFEACISNSDLLSMTDEPWEEQICVKIPHLDMIKTSNVYEATYIPSYLWYERLLPIVALQELNKAYRDYRCVDTEFCSYTNCMLIHFHNAVDAFGIKSKTWNQSIRTPVHLRDFCKYVMHDEADWLKQQEEKYKELNGKVELDKSCPSTSRTSSKCENRYSFVGYDYGRSRLQLTGATTTFHSLDGYKVTVDKTTLLGQTRKVSINVTIKDHSFIVHYIDKKRTSKEPFLFHIVLADGTIIAFNKPPKVSNRQLIIGELIKKRKKGKFKLNPNSPYRPRDKNFFYTVDVRICEEECTRSESSTINSKNSIVAIYRILPSHLTGLIDSKHNPTIKFVTQGQSLVAVDNCGSSLGKGSCDCYKAFSRNRLNLSRESTEGFTPIVNPDQSELQIDKGNDNDSGGWPTIKDFQPWTYQNLYHTCQQGVTEEERESFNWIPIPPDNFGSTVSHISISYKSSVLKKANEMETFKLDLTSLDSATFTPISLTDVYPSSTTLLVPNNTACTLPSTTTLLTTTDVTRSDNTRSLPALVYDDVSFNGEEESDSSSKCCTSLEMRQSTVFCHIKLNREIFPSLANIEKGEIEFFPLDMPSPRYGAAYVDSAKPLIFKPPQKVGTTCASTSCDLLSEHIKSNLTTDLTPTPLAPCMERLLLKIEEAKQKQIPLFKILSSKLHKFVYVKRIKSHLRAQVGNKTIKVLCKHPCYKLKKIVKVAKLLPKKMSSAKFTNKQFYDMKLSLPTGLLIYTTPGINTEPYNIKQQYLHKGPQTKAVVEEESRTFLRSGHLVIRRCDGTIHILSTNGQIVQCELPYRIERTYAKYKIYQKESVQNGENNKALPRFKRKVRRLVCRLQKHIISRKYKCYNIFPKQKHRYNKSKCTFRETEDPLKFILIADDGRISTITGTGIANKEKKFQAKHECRDHDGCQEFFYTRDDGVKCLLTENGVLTTEFYDKTRISTWFTIEPELIVISEPDKRSWEAHVSTGSSLLTSSQVSFILRKYLQSINIQQNGWVSVNIIYKFEHPNYATVVYSKLDHRTKIILPNKKIITASGRGFYTVNLDGLIRARVNNDHIHMESNLCGSCTQSSVTVINLKPMYENIHPLPQNIRLLQTYDSYNKTFIVNYDGTYCRNSDFINSRSNRIGCKVHSKEDSEKLYVLNRDLSAIKFWNIKAYERRMIEATKCNNSITEFYDEIVKDSKMYRYLQVRKYQFIPYPERFTNFYEYNYLIPSQFQRSLKSPLAYCLTLEIHSLSAAITSELLYDLASKLYSYQRDYLKFSSPEIQEEYLKILSEECSLPRKKLQKKFTAIFRNKNVEVSQSGFYQTFKSVTAKDVLKPVPLHTEMKKCPKVYHLPQTCKEETSGPLPTPVPTTDTDVQCGCEHLVTNKFRWDMLGLKRPTNTYFKPGGQKTKVAEVNTEQREDKARLMKRLRKLSDNPEKKTEAITCYVENCIKKQKSAAKVVGVGVMENGYLKFKKCVPKSTCKDKPLMSTKPNKQKLPSGQQLTTQKLCQKQCKAKKNSEYRKTTTQHRGSHRLKSQHHTTTCRSAQTSDMHVSTCSSLNEESPNIKFLFVASKMVDSSESIALEQTITESNPLQRTSTESISTGRRTTQNTYVVERPAKKRTDCQRPVTRSTYVVSQNSINTYDDQLEDELEIARHGNRDKRRPSSVDIDDDANFQWYTVQRPGTAKTYIRKHRSEDKGFDNTH